MLGLIKRAYSKFWERQQAKLLPSPETDQAWKRGLKILRELGASIPDPPLAGCQHQWIYGNEYCRRRGLDGADRCMWHHRSTKKYNQEVVTRYFGEPITFREAIEREVKSGASLSGSYLEAASLGGNWFRSGANLTGADLRGANLRTARLSYSVLQGADLSHADLEDAYLGDAVLDDANLTAAKLFNAKFRNNDLRRVRGLEKNCFRNFSRGLVPKYRMLETYPDQAEPMYRALVGYFAAAGALEDASWAAYRYGVMRNARLRGKLSFTTCMIEALVHQYFTNGAFDVKRAFENAVGTWLSSLFAFSLSWVYRWISGYGEKPLRVAMFSGVIVLSYAGIYDACHVLAEEGFRTALYFSLVTFSTLGYGDLVPTAGFRLFAASEAIAGLVLSGLFLFTLSRRSVGRA